MKGGNALNIILKSIVSCLLTRHTTTCSNKIFSNHFFFHFQETQWILGVAQKTTAPPNIFALLHIVGFLLISWHSKERILSVRQTTFLLCQLASNFNRSYISFPVTFFQGGHKESPPPPLTKQICGQQYVTLSLRPRSKYRGLPSIIFCLRLKQLFHCTGPNCIYNRMKK